jgi:hypothetical protein
MNDKNCAWVLYFDKLDVNFWWGVFFALACKGRCGWTYFRSEDGFCARFVS